MRKRKGGVILIEPNFDTLRFNECKYFIDKQKVVCKTDIRAESCKKILGITISPCVEQEDASQNRVNYSGKVIFSVFYLSSEGNILKTERAVEFMGKAEIEGVSSSDTVFVWADKERVEHDLSGSYLSVTAIISVSGKIGCINQITALKGGENLLTKTEPLSICRNFPTVKGAYVIDEEFELGIAVEEVYSQRATVCLTNATCGVGTVVFEGEAYFSALLLQNPEKKDIIRENKVVPFRFETEYPDAMPQMTAICTLKQKALKTEISVDRESGKSTVRMMLTVCYQSTVYAEEEIGVTADCFSVTDKLDCEIKGYEYSLPLMPKTVQTDVSVSTEVNVEEGAILTSFGCEEGEITEIKRSENGLTVLGYVEGFAYFYDDQSGSYPYKISLPFEKEVLISDLARDFRAEGVVCSCVATRSTSGEITLTLKLFISVYPTQKREFRYIEGVKSVGEKCCSTSAISVYIPMPDEDLWGLSKRLSVCPEQLMNANPDLQFPLSGDERIVVFRSI